MVLKSLYLIFFVLIVVLAVLVSFHMAKADCLSGKFTGGCAIWDNELCRRLCREEGRQTGHCSPSLKCWCEGC